MPWSGLVGGSLWNITVTTRNKVCTITIEEFQPAVADSRNLLLLHRLKVSGNCIDGKVLSWPKAVCRQGNILVTQFITHNNPYIQFLVVDLVEEQCFTFCDNMRHFRRSYALMGSVECCLSPDHHTMLLRLPRVVARTHSSSLSLMGQKRFPTRPIDVQQNPVHQTASFRFNDRKLSMLLFDPRFARRLVSLQVSEFCTKCSILIRDLDNDVTVLQKSVHLGQLSAVQMSVADAMNSVTLESPHREDSGDDSDDSSDSDSIHPFNDLNAPLLVSRATACKAEYSRSAERMVMCCLVENQLQGGTYVRVFVFESDMFTCIAKYLHSLEERDPTESLGTYQLSFSPCDSQVHIMLPGPELGRLLCTFDIHKPLSLRNSCRTSILNTISDCRDIESLPLPPALKAYLLFKWDRFV